MLEIFIEKPQKVLIGIDIKRKVLGFLSSEKKSE